MTISIELPPELEAQLGDPAAKEGCQPEDYVREIVRRQLLHPELQAMKHRKRPKSLAELEARIPSPPGSNGLAEIAGKWPGKETDEEIRQALEELS
jgi:hypothetical protein